MIVVVAGAKQVKGAVLNECLDDVEAKLGKIRQMRLSPSNVVAVRMEAIATPRGIKCEFWYADQDNLDVEGAIVKTRDDGTQYNANAGRDRERAMMEGVDALLVIGLDNHTRRLKKIADSNGVPIMEFVIKVEDKES